MNQESNMYKHKTMTLKRQLEICKEEKANLENMMKKQKEDNEINAKLIGNSKNFIIKNLKKEIDRKMKIIRIEASEVYSIQYNNGSMSDIE